MREMISVQIADQDACDARRSGAALKHIRTHIWTKRSKIQKHGSLPPPILQNEQPLAGVVPHFIGRSRFVSSVRVIWSMPCTAHCHLLFCHLVPPSSLPLQRVVCDKPSGSPACCSASAPFFFCEKCVILCRLSCMELLA